MSEMLQPIEAPEAPGADLLYAPGSRLPDRAVYFHLGGLQGFVYRQRPRSVRRLGGEALEVSVELVLVGHITCDSGPQRSAASGDHVDLGRARRQRRRP